VRPLNDLTAAPILPIPPPTPGCSGYSWSASQLGPRFFCIDMGGFAFSSELLQHKGGKLWDYNGTRVVRRRRRKVVSGIKHLGRSLSRHTPHIVAYRRKRGVANALHRPRLSGVVVRRSSWSHSCLIPSQRTCNHWVTVATMCAAPRQPADSSLSLPRPSATLPVKHAARLSHNKRNDSACDCNADPSLTHG
jgi:hypothetical protein